MLKISKLADYATVVMNCLAIKSDVRFSASMISQQTKIALPTVSKLLKLLNDAKLLNSTRGPNGGYQLACTPDQISIAAIITAVDGRPAITQCSQGKDICVHDRTCALRGTWQFINRAIFNVLDNLTLDDIKQSPRKILNE